MSFSCTLCGGTDWPNTWTSCPLCRVDEPEDEDEIDSLPHGEDDQPDPDDLRDAALCHRMPDEEEVPE